MKDKTYNNADSFSMSFDDAWKEISCEDTKQKIDMVIEKLSDHPFLISYPDDAIKIAKFRIYSLKKFQNN